MNEADTRAELIDPQLKAAGWGVIDGSRIHREYPIAAGEIRPGGIRAGVLAADYALIYKNRILAVVEAKSDETEVDEGVAQAKLYAQKLQVDTTFAANGVSIYEISIKNATEREVSEFPSPDDLWNQTFPAKNDWQEKLGEVNIDTVGGTKSPRYYQEIAINKAVDAIANGETRILLTLATGTGKTFIASQIVWKLFNSRWNLQKDAERAPRILFLADRNILADQAYLDFGSFTEDARARIRPGEIRRSGKVPTNASVFFAIFQTFMSGPDGQPYFGQYPPDFFDFVIIDECHRGGANDESSWRDILDYFKPAVQLGLTATPKRQDNVDTYEYFGEPVYTYSLKEGIRDGFLTPFKVKRIQTTVDEYTYVTDDKIIQGDVEEGKVYKEKDFNKIIEIEAREKKRVQDMLASMNEDEKTLVFCANQAHAAKVRNLINQESNSTSVDYCVRVTANDGLIGETHLRNFQDNDKTIPTILTTSQKLSTGVDARNIRNIVLMRPINSMIEFKQIIGRGTRLFDGKYYFTIVDFVNAFRLFNDPEWDGEPMDPEPPTGGGGGTGGTGGSGGPTGPRPRKIKIRMSDGRERELQSMTTTNFFIDGKMVGIEEFMQKIFNTLQIPGLLKDEESLRSIWSNPITRRDLLQKLEDQGCAKDHLLKIQEMIEAQNSDLFDVLEYINSAAPPISRKERVQKAETNIYSMLNAEQKEFIQFVLSNYINDGVDELDDRKLAEVVSSKYKSMVEAGEKLGEIAEIRELFIDFQKHLYLENVS